MSWEAITLAIIAASGTLAILLSQVRDILIKMAEVIEAWKGVQHAIKRTRNKGIRKP